MVWGFLLVVEAMLDTSPLYVKLLCEVGFKTTLIKTSIKYLAASQLAVASCLFICPLLWLLRGVCRSHILLSSQLRGWFVLECSDQPKTFYIGTWHGGCARFQNWNPVIELLGKVNKIGYPFSKCNGCIDFHVIKMKNDHPLEFTFAK